MIHNNAMFLFSCRSRCRTFCSFVLIIVSCIMHHQNWWNEDSDRFVFVFVDAFTTTTSVRHLSYHNNNNCNNEIIFSRRLSNKSSSSRIRRYVSIMNTDNEMDKKSKATKKLKSDKHNKVSTAIHSEHDNIPFLHSKNAFYPMKGTTTAQYNNGKKLKNSLMSSTVDDVTITASTTTTTSSALPLQNLLIPFGIIAVAAITTLLFNNNEIIKSIDISYQFDLLINNPQQLINDIIYNVEDMGTIGMLYYGIFYCIAEILCIPATPLTMSAGYLFGLQYGSCIVLSSALIAASISFIIGKTYLRTYIENNILYNNIKLQKLDIAIGNDGFKILLLARLSPIFPFAISNYIYGASSINFINYFFGTLFGFIPGTIALIYTGMVGKELSTATLDHTQQPWYIYAIGFGVILTFLKVITDVSTNIISAITDDDEDMMTNDKKKIKNTVSNDNNIF